MYYVFVIDTQLQVCKIQSVLFIICIVCSFGDILDEREWYTHVMFLNKYSNVNWGTLNWELLYQQPVLGITT